MQCSSSAVQCDFVLDGFGVSHGLMGGGKVSDWCSCATMSFLFINVRGSRALRLDSASGGDGTLGALSLKRSLAKSSQFMSLRLLVNSVGVIVSRSIAAGDGEGGRFGQ
jgi:hypothetical protein